MKAFFLQIGEVQRDVSMRHPKESQMKSTNVFLFINAAYGLVNANVKWQIQ